MKKKYLWAAIAILLALVLGLAGYIYEQGSGGGDPAPTGFGKAAAYRKAMDAQLQELARWREKVRRQAGGGGPLLDPDFDRLFDDRFFGRKYDPFAEMDRIHRQVLDTLALSERPLFDEAWGKWYGRRMRMGQFKTEVTRTGRDVTLAIRLPGLTARAADIDIADGRIKIAFSARTVAEEKTAGGTIKKGSAQDYVKILPVPEDAVPGTGQVQVDGELVKIKFDRRKAAR